jgi:hypothetical protein
VYRIHPLRPSVLFAVALFALVAGPSSAITADPDGSPSVPTSALIEVLCTGGACANLDLPDTGMGFEYVFGGRPTTGGLALDVSTTGSIFVLGPMRATESITLEAIEIHVHVNGDVNGNGDGDVGDGGGAGIEIEVPSLDIELADFSLPSYPVICACTSIVDLGGEISLDPVIAQDPAPPTPLSWTASFQGDVYLDLSPYEHVSISLFAESNIVIVNDPNLPVPEPGTALLLGLGLAGLAGVRRHAR